MDADISNGSSDSAGSGTALLSRKGLFGKSGVLNENLDSSVAINQDTQKLEEKKSDPNNDEQNTSTLDFITHEHVSEGNTSKEEEPSPENEHTTTEEPTECLEPRTETNPSPPPSVESVSMTDSLDKDHPHDPSHNEDENEDHKETEENGSRGDREMEEDENQDDRENEENENKDGREKEENESEDSRGNEESENKGDEEKEESDEGSQANEQVPAGDHITTTDIDDEQEANEEASGQVHGPGESKDDEQKAAEQKPPTPEPCHEEVAEPEVVEEICVKKIISMDTDDVEDQTEKVTATVTDDSVEPTDNVMEVEEEVANEGAEEVEELHDETEEKMVQEGEPVSENPDVEMSEQLDDDVTEVVQPSSESEAVITGEIGEANEKVDDESSSRDVTSKDETSKDEAKEAEDDEEKEATPPKRRSSSRRSAAAAVPVEPKVSTRTKATPSSATRMSSRKRQDDEEKADDEERPVASGKAKKPDTDAKKKVENVEESVTPRQTRRRSNVEETKKTTAATPSKGKKNSKKDATEAEDEDVDEEEQKKSQSKQEEDENRGTKSSPRRRSSRVQTKVEETPKLSPARRGRTKNESNSSTTEKEAKSEGNADVETPRKLRKSAATPATPQTSKKSAKTPKSVKKEDNAGHDPYDIDTEMERHPEPLKNIQMEVQSFGEVKYAKVGSGKYERTEKTAELRVVNLAEMTPRTKQRKSLADLTPGRKKAISTISGSNTAPQPSRRSRKSSKREADTDNEENKDEGMEVDTSANEKSTPKRNANATTPKATPGSGRKRKAPTETPVVPPKRHQVEIPQLAPAELLAVDYPQDEHAQYEAGARVYAMFDGLFYPAIVVSRDGLGRYKVHFIEDDLVKDVPPAGVIPLRALDRDKECYYSESSDKDRLAVKVVKSPDHTNASAWFEAEFELEQLNDDGEPLGKKFKGTWTTLALSKDDWREYINRKSREATDVIADNIESTEDRHLRRSKVATPVQKPIPRTTPKSSAKKSETSPSSQSKTPAKGGRQKKGGAAKQAKAGAVDEEAEGAAEAQNDQIFAGMLFILTSANRPNTDTGFKKKFMTDFISSHGGLVVDDMKEVDEHPEMERFLISDTHYRTHKYLAALVRAMPCVSHEWIYKCLEEKKLVDYKPFLLPSGVSILDEQEYPLPTKRGLLLRNKRVMVHSNVTPPSKKSMSFEQIWVPMVPHLGGEIVTEMPNEKGKLDILLTDHSATASLVEKARKIGCAVVSSEWLIQGIIMDRLPDVNAHQKFLHNGGVCT
ncbi:hypothetical protein V3C99_003700 [Haemonchus contortus]|uniref:BRCT domain-containing protein n=1 Tax=Haemonchus contortus TaxID=6289 RepID=A0A7I4XZA3_HAECO|nr:BRCT domain containing protein [Haemonchus contortus]